MGIDWHIGDVIKKLREAKRWNQAKLADTVGVNKATIVRAEQGDLKVARETYLRIAVALGTTLAGLERAAQNLEDAPTLHDVERSGDARMKPSMVEVQPFPSSPSTPDQGGAHTDGSPTPLADVVDRLAELAADLHRNCLAFANKLAECVAEFRDIAADPATRARPGGSQGSQPRHLPRDRRVGVPHPPPARTPIAKPKEKRRA